MTMAQVSGRFLRPYCGKISSSASFGQCLLGSTFHDCSPFNEVFFLCVAMFLYISPLIHSVTLLLVFASKFVFLCLSAPFTNAFFVDIQLELWFTVVAAVCNCEIQENCVMWWMGKVLKKLCQLCRCGWASDLGSVPFEHDFHTLIPAGDLCCMCPPPSLLMLPANLHCQLFSKKLKCQKCFL